MPDNQGIKWKIIALLLCIMHTVIYYVTQLICVFAYQVQEAFQAADTGGDPTAIDVKMLIIVSTVSVAGLLAIYGLVYFLRSQNIAREFKFNKISVKEGTLSVTAGFCSHNLVILVMGILSILAPWLQKTFADYQQHIDPLTVDIWISFIIVGIITPILEELFFRGIILSTLDKAFGKKSGILISALIFGIVHFNVIQSTYAFFLGVFLAFLYYKFDSIFAPILFHITFNFTNSFITQILTKNGEPQTLLILWFGTAAFISILFLPFCLFFIAKSRPKVQITE